MPLIYKNDLLPNQKMKKNHKKHFNNCLFISLFHAKLLSSLFYLNRYINEDLAHCSIHFSTYNSRL